MATSGAHVPQPNVAKAGIALGLLLWSGLPGTASEDHVHAHEGSDRPVFALWRFARAAA
jgi:hypothetical protein